MRISERVTVATILGITVFVGMSMWGSSSDEQQPDAQARLLPIIRASHAKEQLALKARDSLSRVAARATAKHEASASLFSIDTTTPAPGLAVTPTADTTTFGWIIRKTDAQKFMVPLFFIDAYDDAVVAYATQRMLVVYDSTTVLPLKDTLIVQLHQLADSNKAESDYWQAKAHLRCARKCTSVIAILGTLVGVKLTR